MWLVGMVGPIAGGKSTISKRLESLGVTRWDADEVATEVAARGEVVDEIRSAFGDAILAADGSIDRRRLATRVFADGPRGRSDLSKLEAIIHPRVRRELQGQIADAIDSGATAGVLDVPLLIESDWHRCCDEVWFLEVSEAVLRSRVRDRGWTWEQWQQRSDRQLPMDDKKRHATRVVDANLNAERSKTEMQRWLSETLDRCSETTMHCRQFCRR